MRTPHRLQTPTLQLAIAVVSLVGIGSALTGGAAAAKPKPLLVVPSAESVGGIKIGDPAIVVVSHFGPPDTIGSFPGRSGGMLTWLATLRTARAVAMFDTAAEDHVSSLYYGGSIMTRRGDRTGTTLAVFHRHWPEATQERDFPALPGRRAVSVSGVTFIFDKRGQLSGVVVGTDEAAEFAVYARSG